MGMSESRRERYLKALEIAERHGNKFMAANIRAELRKLERLHCCNERTTTWLHTLYGHDT